MALALAVLIYYREKVSSRILIANYFLILALILGYLFLPNAYVVDNSGYKKKVIIGRYSMEYDNEEVYITDHCVINNSERMLYVETIRYIYSSGYSSYGIAEIAPHSIYKGKIDYAFREPPQSIRTNVLVKDSFERTWLREK